MMMCARILLVCLVAVSLTAQDTVLTKARAIAAGGQRPAAIALLRGYLDGTPDSDARVLLGQILSWDGQYDAARQALHTVLAGSPNHGDAVRALINVELWSGHPERAAELARSQMQYDPRSSDLQLALAKALKALGKPDDARGVVSRVLDSEPSNADALRMRSEIIEAGRNVESAINQASEWFNDGTTTWFETQVTLKQETAAGSVIGRFSQAQRFSMTSRASEVEFYPRLRPGTYMYLGGGYSSDRRLYPRFRSGAELFQSIGHGVEVSGGFRSLSFAERVTIYTGSLGKYYGNWYGSIRTFLTPGDAGVSRSFQFMARRYFGAAGTDYIGLRFGRGSSPVEYRSVQDISILRLTSFGVEANRRVSSRFTWSARFGMSREDRLHRAQLLHGFADTGLAVRF